VAAAVVEEEGWRGPRKSCEKIFFCLGRLKSVKRFRLLIRVSFLWCFLFRSTKIRLKIECCD
jgi:hypothetical protein